MTAITVLVGTDDGLLRLDDGVVTSVLDGHSVDHVTEREGAGWAILDRDAAAEIDAGGTLIRTVPLPGEQANCVLAGSSGTWVGASRASLWRLEDGALARVSSFDEAPGREGWHTPWGGPPDVRSMAEDVDGSLYVNVHVGGVVRSRDGGRSWAATMDIDADVHQVIADPYRPLHAYAATARGLAVTDDGAEEWKVTDAGLHAPYCRAVARSTAALLLSTSDGPRGGRAALYRRPLAGGPLVRCTRGLPEWFSTNLDTHCLVALDAVVVAGDAGGTVFVSADEGDSWEEMAKGLGRVHTVAVLPRSPGS